MNTEQIEQVLRRLWRGFVAVGVVIGFLASALALWAVLFPERALETLDQLRPQLEQMAGDTEIIREDTAAIRDALPSGLQLGELFVTEGCEAEVGIMDALDVILWNHSGAFLQNLDLVLEDAAGAQVSVINEGTVVAHGSTYSRVPGRMRPTAICAQAQDETGALQGARYEVLDWRVTQDLCDLGSGIGSRQFVANYRPASGQRFRGCN